MKSLTGHFHQDWDFRPVKTGDRVIFGGGLVALMADRDERARPPAVNAPDPRPANLGIQQSVRTPGGVTYALSATRGFLVSFDQGSSWIERNQGLSRRVVYPFAELPRIARNKRAYSRRWGGLGPPAEAATPNMTIIEVNADPTPLTQEGISNYFIQGKTGEILPRIAGEVKKRRG